MEPENWSTVKNLMLRFIDIQAVRASVNDIEIVVDCLEAREKAMPIQTSLVDPNLTSPALQFDTNFTT